MVYGKQFFMAAALMVHTEVDAGLVGSRPYHQVHHGFGDVDVAPLPLTSLLTWSPIILLVVSSGIFFFTISNSFYRALPTSSSTTSHLHVVTLLSSVVSHLVALFYLLEVLGDPVLPSILIPCLP